MPALLTAVDSTAHVHLIVGSGPLIASRCDRSLSLGAHPIVIAPDLNGIHRPGFAEKVDQKLIQWQQRGFYDESLTTLGRAEVDFVVDRVFAAGTDQAAHISKLCKRLRIPVNVADSAALSTFTLLSTHTSGALQIGITTSGNGCKLASRIRREVAASLPQELGSAIERIGQTRRRLREEDTAAVAENEDLIDGEGKDEDAGQSASFNRLVLSNSAEEAKLRRMRWLSQICEYWPLSRLAAFTDKDIDTVLTAYRQERVQHKPANGENGISVSPTFGPRLPDSSIDDASRRNGRIVLAGTGPGHPDLLTVATLKAISSADLVLADKLVPAAVLNLVPRRTSIHIARKFPGNADAAQAELHELGLVALREGRTVLRLKQGDPYLYGRGAEEVAFFRSHGFESIVLPGITSALSAPLFASIPVTHRAVSDQVLICTGTGRAGVSPPIPAYLPNQTTVFLMALHRLADLVHGLTNPETASPWPRNTPCAIIERASCPDQRVIRASLASVVAAVEESGSRPPGLLVVGEVCRVLQPSPDCWAIEDGFHGLDFLGAKIGGMGSIDLSVEHVGIS